MRKEAFGRVLLQHEKKDSRDMLMFKYKFVFTSILTSRNKIRKKMKLNFTSCNMTVCFQGVFRCL